MVCVDTDPVNATFSAGVTELRYGEGPGDALVRADHLDEVDPPQEMREIQRVDIGTLLHTKYRLNAAIAAAVPPHPSKK